MSSWLNSLSDVLPRAPQKDGLSASTVERQGLVSPFGYLLSRGMQRGTPVSDVFTGFAYLRMLAGHRRRWKKEIKRNKTLAKELRGRGVSDRPYVRLDKHSLPFKLKWQDMKVVNCAGCRRSLLGESMEWVRDKAIVKGVALVKNLPQKIHLRHKGRPYCKGCVLEDRHHD